MATMQIVDEAVVDAAASAPLSELGLKDEEKAFFSLNGVDELGEKLLSVGRESVFGLTPRMFVFVKTQGQFQTHYMAYQAQSKYGYPRRVSRDELIELRQHVDEAKAEVRRHAVVVKKILENLLSYEKTRETTTNGDDARQLRSLIWRVQDSLKAAMEALEADDRASASLDLWSFIPAHRCSFNPLS
ncbi:hypothetical protein CSUI_009630 [Cystoisospora suis]|uniref:Uncharacterized protein n=1 Tax=Cystoisospora suis TaxID=483139 RepID=A0A2C6KJG6_9APIC|nr:hypothetical protein CSUI_009630 [Cystoisospora suis]